MIAYSYIEKNLKVLDTRYMRSGSIMDKNFASKLAILELCGWIEQSMDDCILSASFRVLKQTNNRQLIENGVSRHHGFEFERNFKPMIINLIGVWGFEKISRSIDSAVELKFINELNVLKSKRNSLAHTYTKGVTQHYDAPSVTIERLVNVKAGLKAYDAALRGYCPR